MRSPSPPMPASAFAFVDMLIGVLADDAGALVWSLDSDFERMERLGLVSRYDPALV